MADLSSAYRCSSDGSAADASALVVANLQSRIGCVGAGEELLALFARIGGLAGGLRSGGKPLEGDLHIMVLEDASALEPARIYPWPSGLQLMDYFEELSAFDGRTPPPTQLVPAVDAVALRAIREEYLRDGGSLGDSTSGIPITDGDVFARMFMRDALPYENDQGLWALPGD
jgi:hypothetical protein